MKTFALASLVSFAATAFGAPHLAVRNPSCKSFTFSVTAATDVWDLAKANINTLDDILAILNTLLFSLIPIKGTYNLVGRYCEPTVSNQNKDTIQLLLHGIQSNKNYWSGEGYPNGYNGDQFSWISYAASQGYPTLSLDRLGSGESDHPDPLLVVQGPFEYHLYHNLVTILKSGSSAGSPLPRSFPEVVLVGHSYGSEIVNNMLHLFPNDVTKAVLTGFSGQALVDILGVSAQVPLPAAVVDPARFGNLPVGYVLPTLKEKKRGSFYGTRQDIDYPDGIFEIDWATRDVTSLGQFVSVYLGQTSAPEYKGRVLVLTGINDNAFCGVGQPVPPMGADCRPVVPKTKAFFPNADFSYYMPNNTGHDVNNHYSAQESFKAAHQFFAGAKFAFNGDP